MITYNDDDADRKQRSRDAIIICRYHSYFVQTLQPSRTFYRMLIRSCDGYASRSCSGCDDKLTSASRHVCHAADFLKTVSTDLSACAAQTETRKWSPYRTRQMKLTVYSPAVTQFFISLPAPYVRIVTSKCAV